MSLEEKFFYTNSVQVAITPYDFSLKFTRNGTETDNTPRPSGTLKVDVPAKVLDVMTVSMSPSHAKALLVALKQIVDMYEQRHGLIPVPVDVKNQWDKYFPH